jgi:hypothetical protein
VSQEAFAPRIAWAASSAAMGDGRWSQATSPLRYPADLRNHTMILGGRWAMAIADHSC